MGDYSSMRDFVGICPFVTIFFQKQAQKWLILAIFLVKFYFLRHSCFKIAENQTRHIVLHIL